MRHPLPFMLAAGLVALASLPSCSRTSPEPAGEVAGATAPTTTPAQAPAETLYRFRIGELEAIALKDGDITVANDGKTFGVGQRTEDVASLLSADALPADVLHLSIQPLLVRSGARVLLFDTGAADAAFARAGRLPDALRAAGVAPADVTDVFLSHRHADHAGGLLSPDGTPAFENATVHLSAPEWNAMRSETEAAALVAAIAPRVDAFEPGATLVPGVVTAVAADGHTPGHSLYEIASGEARLLYIGDSAHHHVVSVQRPYWTVAFDENAPRAQERRRALLQRAAEEDLRVYSVHFPFPGLGRIELRERGFAWAPEG